MEDPIYCGLPKIKGITDRLRVPHEIGLVKTFDRLP